jgi:hypothetical protein
MTRLGFRLLSLVLSLIILGIVGCGSSRQLQSVRLSPATADAQSFPNGQVQFTATGTYSSSPSPVQLTSQDVMWCVGSTSGLCVGNVSPGATVNQNGLAQCVPTFAGTVTILAGTGSSVMMIPDTGSQLAVFGAAQMSCP